MARGRGPAVSWGEALQEAMGARSSPPLCPAVLGHLRALVNLMEQYYHPSNSGR